MKMISNDLRSSCRSLLIGAYQGTTSDGEWEYPSDWAKLNPGTGQIQFFMRPANTESCTFYIYVNSQTGTSIDWGDGTTDFYNLDDGNTNWSWYASHTWNKENAPYTIDGAPAFLTTVTLGTDNGWEDEQSYTLPYRDYFEQIYNKTGTQVIAMAIGYGASGRFRAYSSYDWESVQYLKICRPLRENDLIVQGANQFFSSLGGLKRIDFTVPPECLPMYFLMNNGYIKKIDMPTVTKVSNYGHFQKSAVEEINLPNVEEVGASFAYNSPNLVSVNMPNLKKTGDDFCNYCQSLRKLVVSENCTFGSNSGKASFQLYPPITTTSS